MLPETTQVVRDTLPKCPREMAQDPVGAQDGRRQSFSTHNMTALALTTSSASAQGEARSSPHTLQKTLPQQATASQQTEEGRGNVSQEQSHSDLGMDLQEEYRDAFFRSLGLKRKGSTDPLVVDASHDEQSVLPSAENGSVEETMDCDMDVVPEENWMEPLPLEPASHSIFSTGGRRPTLSNCWFIENHQNWREEGFLHEEEGGNGREGNPIVIRDSEEEEDKDKVELPVPPNRGMEVAKEKQKKEDGKTKSDEDRLKEYVKRIPVSSPFFQVPLLEPLHHITTTTENNIIRSYEEYCKPNSGEKLRSRNFPTSCKRTETAWCHKYKFNRAQRQEFNRVLRTGLTKRSRALLQTCKKCSVDLERLSAEKINRYRTRVVRKEIHYDDDLIMIVDEIVAPSSTSEVNPVQSQTLALANHLAGSTSQPSPFLQRPPSGISCRQVVRPLSGQIRGQRLRGPKSARILSERDARKVVMKPKEVEKTFKGKEAGGVVRKTVYTPCQGEVRDPIRNRGSHIPNILLSGGSTPQRTPPLPPKKSLPTLRPKPFPSISNPNLHLIPQPQPNSQPNCSSHQHPTSVLVPCGQAFEDRNVLLQPTPYFDPQHRTQNDMDELLRQYNIIGPRQNSTDNQVADMTQMPHADTSLVYLQANPDGAMQCVNMPVSSVSFPSGLPFVPLRFPSVGLPGEQTAMGSGVYDPVPLALLTSTSEVGDFTQTRDRPEASDGQVVSTTLPVETSINLDSDDDVILISDDESN